MHAMHPKTPRNTCTYCDVVALYARNTANSKISVGFVCEVTYSHIFTILLTLSDPTSDLVRQYDFPVLLRCQTMSHTVFVAFLRPLSEPVRCFFSCSTDFSQQIAQVVLFLYLHVFLF
jgi:hypothetical protein